MSFDARKSRIIYLYFSEHLSKYFSGFATTALLVSFLLLNACTNNLTNIGNKSGNTSGDPIINTGSSQAFSITNVVKSNYKPAENFDIISDTSGGINEYCTPLDANTAGDPTKPTQCNCSYEYTDSQGNIQRVETPTIYHEENLVRCKYAGVIPAGITSLKASIHISNLSSPNDYTNPVTVSLGSYGNNLDPTKADSYSGVIRYPCRDTVWVSNPMFEDNGTSNIYDPFLSKDPKLNYPLNFYTSNPAFAIQTFTSALGGTSSNLNGSVGNGLTWECPVDLKNPPVDMDMRVFSNDGSQIYPVMNPTNDKHNFLVMREMSGAFNVPVNTMLAPNLNSAKLNDGIPMTPDTATTNSDTGAVSISPIGYGAAPIPLGNDIETCPDTSVVIPTGYKWKKLWLFRASLEDRKYSTSVKAAAWGSVACNPGKKDADSETTNAERGYYFPNCMGPATHISPYRLVGRGQKTLDDGFGGYFGVGNSNPSENRVVSRVFDVIGEGNVCVLPSKIGITGDFDSSVIDSAFRPGQFNGSLTNNATADPTHPFYGADEWFATFPGVDTFSPNGTFDSPVEEGDPSTYGSSCADAPWRCASPLCQITGSGPLVPTDLQMRLCSGSLTSSSPNFKSRGYYPRANGSDLQYPFFDSDGALRNYDNGNSRFDYLFVLSDPNEVNVADFKNNTAKAQEFIPFRYYSTASSDITNVIHYEPLLHDLANNPDSDPTLAGRIPMFPVCVIQKEP